jgi:hypothetical protein
LEYDECEMTIQVAPDGRECRRGQVALGGVFLLHQNEFVRIRERLSAKERIQSGLLALLRELSIVYYDNHLK